MDIRTAYSVADSVPQAVTEIRDAWRGHEPRLVVFFASPRYQPAELSRAMKEAFAGADVVGCTTAGEIVSGRMLKGSVVAMGLGRDAVEDVHVELVRGIRDEGDVRPAFAAFERHFGTPAMQMDYRTYAGIVLFDGLSGAEERMMERIGTHTNVVFVGGSAGDDLKFSATHVCANGAAARDAAVLVLLKSRTEVGVVKTQSFRVLDVRFKVTRADERRRQVFELDGQPALAVYAAAVKLPPAQVADAFMRHPVGVIAGAEPFVRSPQKVDGDSLVFYCNLQQGMEVALLESTDIPRDTRAAVAARLQDWGSISAILNFHCILRTLELENKGQTEQYGDIFASIPTIGFSTYGEAFLGHINQTSTMLVFR